MFLKNQFNLYQRQQQSQQSKQDLFETSMSQSKVMNQDDLSTEKRPMHFEPPLSSGCSSKAELHQQTKQLEMEDQIQKYFSSYENQFNQEYLQFNKEFH